MRETASGYLWSQPGVPHKGWQCAGVDDLGYPIGTCDMCGKVDIRYIHHMGHPDYQDLAVGCICAGHMSGDYDGARQRERDLRNAAARRKRESDKRERDLYKATARRERERDDWTCVGWQESVKGNLWRKHKGTFLLVFTRRGGYGVKIGDDFDARTFLTTRDAKLALLDYVSS